MKNPNRCFVYKCVLAAVKGCVEVQVVSAQNSEANLRLWRTRNYLSAKNPRNMSNGNGKMMVEFFSDAMLFKVCR